ncbi:MAG: DUF2029 domain-containing protein [Candidatus Magasanikbacteria bacterium]|nr:DUF2029 domain-containing protein [Candidatus Magasanikbacteria bacterium]
MLNSESRWIIGFLASVIVMFFWGLIWYRLSAGELVYDFSTHYSRGLFFLEHGGWQGMNYNEYPPGALWYFVFLAALVPQQYALTGFIVVAMFSNAILSLWFVKWHYEKMGTLAAFIGWFFLLAAGPVLFFRFEILVSIFVVLAWFMAKQQKMSLAGFFLGLGVAMKIYPVILLPILILETLKKQQKDFFALIGGFILGVLLPVLAYVLFGGSFGEVFASYQFHGLKPIGVDSLWSSILVVYHFFSGLSLSLVPQYGIYGVTSVLALFPVKILNYAWVLPFGLVFVYIIWRFRKVSYTHPIIPLALILTYLVFAKVLNIQYLWWAMSFLPWVLFSYPIKKERLFVGAFAVIVLGLSHIVYPIYFFDLVHWFENQGAISFVLFILILRNIFLLIFLVVILRWIFVLSRIGEYDIRQTKISR